MFLVLHAPEPEQGGRVHYVELDQFIGPRYVVTVHGPVNPAVPPEAALRETRAVLGRIEAGRLRPRSAFELSYAIVSALALVFAALPLVLKNLADADEIFVSQDVYEAKGVRDELAGYSVEPRTAQLRGVQQELPVFRVGGYA